MDEDIGDAKQPESVAAVLKVFAILNALGERSDIGITDLSVRLAMPKATVYRFLQTMKTLGYVRQEVDSERYGLSMRVFELGAKALKALVDPLVAAVDLGDVAEESAHDRSSSCSVVKRWVRSASTSRRAASRSTTSRASGPTAILSM